jgi:putrescine transport system substrate-binding protein
MRYLWIPVVGLALSLATGLTGCSRDEARPAGPGAAAALTHAASHAASAAAASGPVADGVMVYTWSDYLPEATVQDFGRQTGLALRQDNFDFVHEIAAQLAARGTGHDVVVPSAALLGPAARAGRFARMERDRLPNWRHLDPEILALLAQHDEHNAHAVPYLWGTQGIAYGADAVRRAAGGAGLGSWGLLFDPRIGARLQACGIAVPDDPMLVIDSLLVYLGRDPNAESLEDLRVAERAWHAARPHLRVVESGRLVEELASGRACAALVSNVDAGLARRLAEAMQSGIDIAYALPREGSTVWIDVLTIPADAPNPVQAHALIDFLLDPVVIAKLSNELGFANANLSAQQETRPDLRSPMCHRTGQPRFFSHASRSAAYRQRVLEIWKPQAPS